MPEPVTPVAAPAPAATPAEETVAVSKTELENLKRDAARASEAQSRADRYEKVVKQQRGTFNSASATPPPAKDEAELALEDRKAERGLMALANDPAYREVLDSDPTLRNSLIKNPLAILPVILDETPFDAEDAISLVKDVLNKRVSEKAATKKAAEPAPAEKTPVAPPAGGQNVATTVDAEYEAAKKIGNTESAIAAMVNLKGRRMVGS